MRRPPGRVLASAALAAAVVSFGGSSARAAATPYVQTFDAAPTGTTLPGEFTESGPTPGTGASADYSVVPAPTTGNELRALVSATTAASGTTAVAANRSAAVQFPTIPGTNFSITTTFRLDAFSAGGSGSTENFGLAAFGSVADFSSGSQYRLLYTPAAPTAANVGRLTLSETGSSGTTGTLSSAGSIAPTAGLSGTLNLTGTYVGGTLNLTDTLVSGATTLTVTASDPSPLAGDYFGYRTAVNAVLGSGQAGPLTTSEDVKYDNFNVVPEPATAGLLAVAAGGLLVRRRRKA